MNVFILAQCVSLQSFWIGDLVFDKMQENIDLAHVWAIYGMKHWLDHDYKAVPSRTTILCVKYTLCFMC